MNPTLLEAMEELKNLTALLTGLRKDLLNEGWSERAAETVVVTILQKIIAGNVK